jgi:hypothetical protein
LKGAATCRKIGRNGQNAEKAICKIILKVPSSWYGLLMIAKNFASHFFGIFLYSCNSISIEAARRNAMAKFVH